MNTADRDGLLQELLRSLDERYSVTPRELERALSRNVLSIPVSIFTSDLSPLEAIIKYLKENEGLRLVQIAQLIGRDQRAVGVTYKRTKGKLLRRCKPSASRYAIPLSILQDKRLSVFEHVVRHLHHRYTLPFQAIAQLMGKDARTIWTIHHRAQQKLTE